MHEVIKMQMCFKNLSRVLHIRNIISRTEVKAAVVSVYLFSILTYGNCIFLRSCWNRFECII